MGDKVRGVQDLDRLIDGTAQMVGIGDDDVERVAHDIDRSGSGRHADQGLSQMHHHGVVGFAQHRALPAFGDAFLNGRTHGHDLGLRPGFRCTRIDLGKVRNRRVRIADAAQQVDIELAFAGNEDVMQKGAKPGIARTWDNLRAREWHS